MSDFRPRGIAGPRWSRRATRRQTRRELFPCPRRRRISRRCLRSDRTHLARAQVHHDARYQHLSRFRTVDDGRGLDPARPTRLPRLLTYGGSDAGAPSSPVGVQYSVRLVRTGLRAPSSTSAASGKQRICCPRIKIWVPWEGKTRSIRSDEAVLRFRSRADGVFVPHNPSQTDSPALAPYRNDLRCVDRLPIVTLTKADTRLTQGARDLVELYRDT